MARSLSDNLLLYVAPKCVVPLSRSLCDPVIFLLLGHLFLLERICGTICNLFFHIFLQITFMWTCGADLFLSGTQTSQKYFTEHGRLIYIHSFL